MSDRFFGAGSCTFLSNPITINIISDVPRIDNIIAESSPYSDMSGGAGSFSYGLDANGFIRFLICLQEYIRSLFRMEMVVWIHKRLKCHK